MKNNLSHQIGEIVYCVHRKRIGIIVKHLSINYYVVQWIDDEYSLNGIRYSTYEISRLKKALTKYMETQTKHE